MGLMTISSWKEFDAFLGVNRGLSFTRDGQVLQDYNYKLGGHLTADFFGAGEVDVNTENLMYSSKSFNPMLLLLHISQYLMSATQNGAILAQDTGKATHYAISEYQKGQLRFVGPFHFRTLGFQMNVIFLIFQTFTNDDVVATVTYQIV
jgi:hypothetical protein